MRRGQRFESARRLCLFDLSEPKTRNVKKPPPLVQELLDTTQINSKVVLSQQGTPGELPRPQGNQQHI
jgi:hypothetical protein